jgi:hypothetical protein
MPATLPEFASRNLHIADGFAAQRHFNCCALGFGPLFQMPFRGSLPWPSFTRAKACNESHQQFAPDNALMLR